MAELEAVINKVRPGSASTNTGGYMQGASARGDKPTIVELNGTATIETIRELHTLLVEALQSSRSVIVDTSALDRADMSFIQLLFAASASARAGGAAFRVTGESSFLRHAAGGAAQMQELIS